MDGLEELMFSKEVLLWIVYRMSTTGESTLNWFGYSVSTAGDLNGDGYSDVLVGNPLYGAKTYLYNGGTQYE